jgi:hypothetical protein
MPSSRNAAGDFEDFCLSDHVATCNFMKIEALGSWFDDERIGYHKICLLVGATQKVLPSKW